MVLEPEAKAKVPLVVERFVKQLVVTMKAVRLYPRRSSIPRENAQEAAKMLAEFFRDRAEMRLSVHRDGLAFDETLAFEGQPAFQAFARELYNRGLADVRFHPGADGESILSFLETIEVAPDELAAAGGFETRLWDMGVDTITVTEASVRIVQSESEEGEIAYQDDEPWPPVPSRIDEIVTGALGGRPRDQRILTRVVGDPGALHAYIRESSAARGRDPGEVAREMRIEVLANAAAKAEKGQHAALFRTLAEAMLDLDPAVRRAMLTTRLLPEARTNDAMAQVVRQMGVDEVCAILAEGATEDEASLEGLARAIRNLTLISVAEREEVFNAAGAAMLSSGLSEGAVNSVFETVAPSRLRVREHGGHSKEVHEVDSILQLVDLAPGSVSQGFEDDMGFVTLQEESRRGITDGDVVAALVTLVTVDAKGVNFGSMMALLEDNLELTVERGDYEVAADAADALMRVLEEPDLPDVRNKRISAALSRLAGAQEIGEITTAMRLYPPDSSEYVACRRLIDALGGAAVEPLLETLADQPDMAARKALVDLVAGMADQHIDQLGEHVKDSRWYFVRNVVAILGKTKMPEAVPYLGRTLRHGDARVRRETIRALSGIPDRLADEMLIAALDDADAQNVQLAARYLGASRERGAEAALKAVAAGEGRGNRELGPRIEAIEALGRLGAVSAAPMLESLASKRSIIGGGRTRELRTAAEHALAKIRAKGGQQ